MSYTVIVTQRAYLQLSNALEWYLKNATGHEKKLLKTFDKSISSIAKNPLKFQIRYEDIRVCFLETYKYGIHYSIDDKTIYILGFFHHHQNSEDWSLDQ